MMDTQKIIDKLDRIYGSGKGIGIYTTVMPGIIADFERMIKSSKVGSRVSEQYRLEDGRAVLIASGSKSHNGMVDMSIEVTGI